MARPTDLLDPLALTIWRQEQVAKASRCHAAVAALFAEFGEDLVNEHVDIFNQDDLGRLSVRELVGYALRVSSRGTITPSQECHASMTHTKRLSTIRQHIDSIENARQAEADARDEAVEQLRARKVA